MRALRSEVGEQSSNVLLGDQGLRCIVAYLSGSYQRKTFDRFFEPLKVSVGILSMPSFGQLHGR